MKGKLKFVIPIVALVAAFAAYKLVVAKPAETEAKVHGHVYVLPKEFVLNMDGGRYAKLTVGLVLEEAIEAGHGGPSPPEGFGPLEQEALVREIVTEELTGSPADTLTSAKGRAAHKKTILKEIEHQTDIGAEAVVFTDVAVQ